MANCAVCGGSRSEHFNSEGVPLTVHAYTEVQGDLRGAPINQPKSKKNEPVNTEQFNRLLEVLVDNQMISAADLLYVATGKKMGEVTHGHGS